MSTRVVKTEIVEPAAPTVPPRSKYKVRVDYADAAGVRTSLNCPSWLGAPLNILAGVGFLGGLSLQDKWAMRKGEMRAYRKLVKLNPLFILLLPILVISSLGKHLVKKVVS